jgi:hypothetical protein
LKSFEKKPQTRVALRNLGLWGGTFLRFLRSGFLFTGHHDQITSRAREHHVHDFLPTVGAVHFDPGDISCVPPPDQQRNQKHEHKDQEQNLRDGRCSSGYSGESQQPRDDGDNQKQ